MYTNPNTGIRYQEVIEDGVQVLRPMLTLSEGTDGMEGINEPPVVGNEPSPLKKWERARAMYLEQTGMDGFYWFRGTLYSHLAEIQQQAEEMERSLMAQNQSEAPDRKTRPLEWTQYQNSLQSRVDELIQQQLIEVKPDFLNTNRT